MKKKYTKKIVLLYLGNLKNDILNEKTNSKKYLKYKYRSKILLGYL